MFVTQAAQNKGQHLYLHLGLGYLKEIMQKTLQPFAEDVDNNKWAFKLEAWSWAKLIRVDLNRPALSTSSKPDPEPSLNLPSAYSNKALDECWVGIIWGRPNPSSSDPFKAPWICSCTDEWFPNATRRGKAKEGRQYLPGSPGSSNSSNPMIGFGTRVYKGGSAISLLNRRRDCRHLSAERIVAKKWKN